MRADRFAVVALFAPLDVGASIARTAWPAHLTLVSNFAVEAPPERVVGVVRDALVDPPMAARLAGRAMFGARGDVPVQLVEPGPFPGVHETLAAAVERLPGFAADEPEYWHDAYRPHVTLGSAAKLREGDLLGVRCVATAQLTETRGAIIDVLEVAAG